MPMCSDAFLNHGVEFMVHIIHETYDLCVMYQYSLYLYIMYIYIYTPLICQLHRIKLKVDYVDARLAPRPPG